MESPNRARPLRWQTRVRPVPFTGTVPREDVGEHIALIEIDWDAATEYYSFVSVRSATKDHLPYVIRVAPIHRSVSVHGGGMSIGTCTVMFANSERYFSEKLAATQARGRKLRVKFVNIDHGISSALTLFEGQITRWQLSAGQWQVEARNTKFDELFAGRLAQTVPMINGRNFPDIPVGQVEVMAPLIMGRVADVQGNSPGGAAPSYLADDTGPYVYVFAARPMGAESATTNIRAFYVYGVSTGSGTVTTATYNGNVYGVLTFAGSQRDATRIDEMEVTGYINGFTEDDNTASQPILNPVRAQEYLLDAYTSLTTGFDFDTTLQTAAKANAAAMGYADDWGNNGQRPSVLGVVIKNGDLTWREVIEQFNESFAQQLYMTRDGKLATFVPTDEPDPVPDFTVDDESDILRDTLTIRSNDDVASVIQYNYGFRWTFGRAGDPTPGEFFEKQPDYVVPGEKVRLGNYDVRKSISLWYVRSGIRAVDVARVMSEYYKSGAEFIELALPIRFFRQADLNRYIGITHWQGIAASGGYQNVTARIIGMDIDVQPRSARLRLNCFKRVSFTQGKDRFDRADSTSLGSGWTESANVAGAIQISSNKVLMQAANNGERGIAFRTETYGDSQLARLHIIRIVGINGNAVGGIFVRGSGTYDNFTGYALLFRESTGLLELRKYDAEDINTLGTLIDSATAPTGAWSTGSKIELRIDGADLEVFVYSQEARRTGRFIFNQDFDIASGTPGMLWTHEGTTSFPKALEADEFDARDF